MAEHSRSPVFAGRYRYEPVEDGGENYDGFAQLVYDLKTEKMGIIKRADLTSERAVRRLKNEMEALHALQGLGVPEIYDTGESEYDSMNCFYIVLEYVEGTQVEKNLDSLTASERIEILTQFFRLLAEAHERGIVNGDVDLKHLFWYQDKKQLVVIDWDGAKVGVDPQQKTEFADDLARAAGIIFSLVTRNGYPVPMKSFVLPDESGLYPELPKLPIEFLSQAVQPRHSRQLQ